MSEIFTDEQVKFFRDEISEELTDEDTMVAPYGTPVESDQNKFELLVNLLYIILNKETLNLLEQ